MPKRFLISIHVMRVLHRRKYIFLKLVIILL